MLYGETNREGSPPPPKKSSCAYITLLSRYAAYRLRHRGVQGIGGQCRGGGEGGVDFAMEGRISLKAKMGARSRESMRVPYDPGGTPEAALFTSYVLVIIGIFSLDLYMRRRRKGIFPSRLCASGAAVLGTRQSKG